MTSAMMRNLVLLTAVAVACVQAPLQRGSVEHAPGSGQRSASVYADGANAAAAASIRPADFFARIGFLASDALGGRDTPSPGLEAAAAYIASEFHRFSLRPAGDAGSFLQRYPYTTRAVDVGALRFDVSAGDTRRSYAPRSDFYAQPGLRGTFTGGIVVAGPAVTRSELLRGRAALIAPPAALTPGDVTRNRALADSAGAGALIVVLPA